MSIVEDYVKEVQIPVSEPKNDGEIADAKPKVYDYRERYKKRALRPSDVTTISKPRVIMDSTGEFDQINRTAGESLFFGPGTEIDI